MVTKERRTKIVNFMSPEARFLVLGYGYISHIVKMHNISKQDVFMKHNAPDTMPTPTKAKITWTNILIPVQRCCHRK